MRFFLQRCGWVAAQHYFHYFVVSFSTFSSKALIQKADSQKTQFGLDFPQKRKEPSFSLSTFGNEHPQITF